jgi:hypothetical protein
MECGVLRYHPYGMVPESIIKYYDQMHVDLTFRELHDRFGFPVKEWKEKFRQYLLTQPRNTSELDAFVKFGNRVINPVLNEVLCRRPSHDTFNKMLYYVIEKSSGSDKKSRLRVGSSVK